MLLIKEILINKNNNNNNNNNQAVINSILLYKAKNEKKIPRYRPLNLCIYPLLCFNHQLDARTHLESSGHASHKNVLDLCDAILVITSAIHRSDTMNV